MFEVLQKKIDVSRRVPASSASHRRSRRLSGGQRLGLHLTPRTPLTPLTPRGICHVTYRQCTKCTKMHRKVMQRVFRGKGVLHSLFSKKGRPIHIFKLTLGASDSLLNVSIHLLNFGELFLEPRHRQLIVESVMISNDYRITPETWTDMNWVDFQYVQYCSMISSTHVYYRILTWHQDHQISSSDWSDLIGLVHLTGTKILPRFLSTFFRMFWTHFVPIFARVSRALHRIS